MDIQKTKGMKEMKQFISYKKINKFATGEGNLQHTTLESLAVNNIYINTEY